MIESILSRAIAALTWWIDGLWMALPIRIRTALFVTRDRVVVRIAGDQATIELISPEGAEPRSAVVALNQSDAGAMLRSQLPLSEQPEVTVVLPRDVALTRSFSLPASAEAELRAIVYHEIDRLTPFSMDEMVFDCYVRERSANKLNVETVLAQRSSIGAALTALERCGLSASVVTTERQDGSGRIPVNLLRRLPRLPFRGFTWRLPFAVTATASLFAALYVPLWRYEHVLAKHEQTVEEVRTSAVAARAALDEHEATLERIEYLTQLQRDYVAPIELLLELTEKLPDHTWLARFSFTPQEVQLQGESSGASDVLQIVESMARLEAAQFKTPVAPGGELGKDQFTITAVPVRSGR